LLRPRTGALRHNRMEIRVEPPIVPLKTSCWSYSITTILLPSG